MPDAPAPTPSVILRRVVVRAADRAVADAVIAGLQAELVRPLQGALAGSPAAASRIQLALPATGDAGVAAGRAIRQAVMGGGNG